MYVHYTTKIPKGKEFAVIYTRTGAPQGQTNKRWFKNNEQYANWLTRAAYKYEIIGEIRRVIE
jgi:hypothetical protein